MFAYGSWRGSRNGKEEKGALRVSCYWKFFPSLLAYFTLIGGVIYFDIDSHNSFSTCLELLWYMDAFVWFEKGNPHT